MANCVNRDRFDAVAERCRTSELSSFQIQYILVLNSTNMLTAAERRRDIEVISELSLQFEELSDLTSTYYLCIFGLDYTIPKDTS